MTAPTSWRLRVIVIVVIAAVGALAALMIARINAFNNWVAADTGLLQPYGTVLIRDGEIVDGNPDPEPLDPVVISESIRGRHVVELTRSHYWYGLFGNEAWVKTLLVTERPGLDEATIQIKLLNHLRHTRGTWEMSVEELTLP